MSGRERERKRKKDVREIAFSILASSSSESGRERERKRKKDVREIIAFSILQRERERNKKRVVVVYVVVFSAFLLSPYVPLAARRPSVRQPFFDVFQRVSRVARFGEQGVHDDDDDDD